MSYGQSGWTRVSLPANSPRASGAAVAVLTLALCAGTGGTARPEEVLSRFGTGSFVRGNAVQLAPVAQQGLSLQLSIVRAALQLSVAETADLFGVSRPTIYSWQAGRPGNEHHEIRVRALANAIEPYLALLERTDRASRRVISGTATVLDSLRGGRDPVETINMLATSLEQEAAQRARLAARLHGRTRARGAADIDALG